LPKYLFIIPAFVEDRNRPCFFEIGYSVYWNRARDLYGSQDDIRCWQIFWWRQLFHLFGGALVAGPTSVAIALAIFCLVLTKEFFHDFRRGGIWYKSFIFDPLFWAFGAYLSSSTVFKAFS